MHILQQMLQLCGNSPINYWRKNLKEYISYNLIKISTAINDIKKTSVDPEIPGNIPSYLWHIRIRHSQKNQGQIDNYTVCTKLVS